MNSSLEEMMEWYYFKTGSYWIYEELNTGFRDTVTVWHDATGVNGTFPWWEMNTWSTYYHYNFNYEYSESFSTNCLSSPECWCRKVNRIKYKPGDYSGDDYVFLFPLILGNFNNLENGGTSRVALFHAELALPDYTLYNVAQWNCDNCTTEDVNHINWNDGVPAVFYTCKNYGIVKKELPVYNETWILKECSLIQ